MTFRPTANHRRNIKGVALPLTAAIRRMYGRRDVDGALPLGAFFLSNVSPATWRYVGGIWYVPVDEDNFASRRVNEGRVAQFVASITSGAEVTLPSGAVSWEPLTSTEEAQLPAAQSGDEPTDAAEEGARSLALHIHRERNSALRQAKIDAVLAATGNLACQACGFDFDATYGEFVRGFCEVHHLNALGARNQASLTSLQDLALICSNCHRAIHLTNPMWTVEMLAAEVARRQNG